MNARIGHENGNIDFGKSILMTDDLLPLTNLIAGITEPILFFNIGSARSLGDAVGPLLGTLLVEAGAASSDVVVMGTAEDPIHARNISDKIEAAKASYAESVCIATDAAVGNHVGSMRLTPGMLVAGAARHRMLPPIGDYSLLVTTIEGRNGCVNTLDAMVYCSNIGLIYGLARKMADAIVLGLKLRAERKESVAVNGGCASG